MHYKGSVKNKADKARWQRVWRATHPHLVRAGWEKWEERTDYKSNGDQHLRRTFKLTPEMVQQIIADQGGVCLICLEPPRSNNPFVPDHDHQCCAGRKTCGKCLRGLIHRTCNGAIGLLKDDPVIVARAAAYLERHNALAVRSTKKMG